MLLAVASDIAHSFSMFLGVYGKMQFAIHFDWCTFYGYGFILLAPTLLFILRM